MRASNLLEIEILKYEVAVKIRILWKISSFVKYAERRMSVKRQV